ncbi:NfeD family protein [Phenylobacterium sp. SCN 70-31]|uniref:NfeD family protein n=1 Tax=Phenylobacterium sp. SCN 70-31 TaxID=1660129 RepID=UPI0008688503|nr:NfeD family protein [Phenylobacterium sp. SCN 70-31]ODT89364.1 MAG: hypothetical protein ABS78_04065 [Phenylobacterium sp. SCN 70-31]
MGVLTDLYAAQPFWVWAGLAAAILAVEVGTGTGWLLWASASAAVTGAVVGLVDISVPTAVLVFAVLTMTSALLARRYLPRRVMASSDGDINDNIGRLIGRRGDVVQAFKGGSGRVFVDGKEWSAEVADDDALEAGAHVEIVGVEGASLKVRRT